MHPLWPGEESTHPWPNDLPVSHECHSCAVQWRSMFGPGRCWLCGELGTRVMGPRTVLGMTIAFERTAS